MSSEAKTQQPPVAPAAALSATNTKPGSTGSGEGSGGSSSLTSAASAGGDKKVITMKVLGTVKWFNVRKGYGFIHRNDTKEDVFVHQTAIKKNPRKYLRGVGETDWSLMLLKEKRVQRQQRLQALVECQSKAVNTQQTVTIIDAIHVAGSTPDGQAQ